MNGHVSITFFRASYICIPPVNDYMSKQLLICIPT